MYYSPSTQGFYPENIEYKDLPTDLVSITNEEHQALMQAQSEGKLIAYDKVTKKPIAVNYDDLLTDEEKVKRNKENLASQAKTILASNSVGGDWQMLQDVFCKYTKQEQANIIAYRQALRKVINGEIDTLPIFGEKK